jgi:hypothetical protein
MTKSSNAPWLSRGVASSAARYVELRKAAPLFADQYASSGLALAGLFKHCFGMSAITPAFPLSLIPESLRATLLTALNCGFWLTWA